LLIKRPEGRELIAERYNEEFFMAEEAVNPATAEEDQEIPQQLPVLPLHHGVLFP
jgi:hypothetical protein